MTGPELVALVRGGVSFQTLSKADQKVYWDEITRPRFLRMVGAHRANDASFGLAVARRDIEEETFGHISKWSCMHCGPCGEPESHMTYRQTLEQPEEGVERCPSCGSEDCGENQDPDLSCKVVSRSSYIRMSAEDRRVLAEIRANTEFRPLLNALKPITTRIA